jgi:hypothetical protein
LMRIRRAYPGHFKEGNMALRKVFLLILLFAASQAHAGLIFVGQWEVDDGPSWNSGPLANTGQEVAALLFGGMASDYSISTLGADALTIDNMAWYSVLGLDGGHKFAQNYVTLGSTQLPGYYYSGGAFNSGDYNEAASAYVNDNAIGSRYTNYAFVSTVPTPATLALFGIGLAGLGWSRSRHGVIFCRIRPVHCSQ